MPVSILNTFLSGRTAQILCVALSLTVGIVWLLAAFAKAWNIHQFAVVLDHVLPVRLSGQSRLLGAGGLAIWEAMIGTAFATLWTPRWLRITVVATLLAFTGALIVLWRDPLAPGCGCMAWASAVHDASRDVPLGIVRNLAMIGVIAWLPLQTSVRRPAPAMPVCNETKNVEHQGGFTLIELLLVVAVVAILAALALPTFARARERSRDARSLVAMRQVSAAALMYGNDYRESFPYFATPRDPWATITFNGRIFNPPNYFRTLSFYWVALIRDYHEDPRGLMRPGTVREYDPNTGVFSTRYWMTHTAFARAPYWEDPAPNDLGLFCGTSWGDLAHPARKGLLLDTAGGMFTPSRRHAGGRGVSELDALVGFGDGSASVRQWPAVIDPHSVVTRPFGSITWPVMATRRGLAGTDLPLAP